MDDYEKVTHPKHYNWIPGVECIDIIEWMSFNLGNAVKYIWRVGTKPNEDPEIELRKAIFYLEREIARLQEVEK